MEASGGVLSAKDAAYRDLKIMTCVEIRYQYRRITVSGDMHGVAKTGL
ncbi:hypothetical protein NBRC116594_16440 [Shimia sp. NS0008-38b]